MMHSCEGTFRRRARRGRPGLAPAAARWIATAIAACVAIPSAARASQIIAPAVGVPDAGMAGATVGTPLTPTAAAFSNPAGLVGLEAGSMSAGFGLPVGHSRVHATTPPGYDTSSDFVAYAPEGGAVFATESGLRYGFALYGSLGSSFDSDADASVGVDHDFRSDAAVSNIALMAAYPVTDRLSVGVGMALLYGQSHLRYFQSIPFAYTVRGAGVQANVGLRYLVSDHVSLGLSFRTPGMVWAEGDDRLPSGDKQDVELDLDQPAQIFVGVNADLTDRFHAGVSGRWTDSSTFSDSNFRFEKTPAANVPYIGGATDEWRIAAGASYALTEALTVAGGFSYADSIVPDTFASPLVFDTGEWKVTGGLSWMLPAPFAGWTLDATIGESPQETRHVSDSDALIYPGRYSIGGQIYMVGIRTTL